MMSANVYPDLNAGRCGAAAQAGERQHKDQRVKAPRRKGQQPRALDQAANALRLSVDGLAQALEKRQDDVDEQNGGKRAPQCAGGIISSDFEGVAEADIQRDCEAWAEGGRDRLALRQLHQQNQLDQKKRHGQQPVDVPIGIVEGEAGRRQRDAPQRGGTLPAVENPKILIGRNCGNQPRNSQRRLVRSRNLARRIHKKIEAMLCVDLRC